MPGPVRLSGAYSLSSGQGLSSPQPTKEGGSSVGCSPGVILFSYALRILQTSNGKKEHQAGSLQVLWGSQEPWASVPARDG